MGHEGRPQIRIGPVKVGLASAPLHFDLSTGVPGIVVVVLATPASWVTTYKTVASAFNFRSVKVSDLLLLHTCPLALGISCCLSLDPSRHFLLLMRCGKTGRHGHARADREEVRRMCGGSLDGVPSPPYSCSQFGFNWFGIGMTRAYLSEFEFN